jgi:hypothetical protein
VSHAQWAVEFLELVVIGLRGVNAQVIRIVAVRLAGETAQLLARHSDINLAMNTYTMLGVLDQASAVESLPPIPRAVLRDNGQPQ